MDITNQRFGRLVALNFAGYTRSGGVNYRVWKVRCDCGCEFITHENSLRFGLTRSCGCLRNEKSAERCRERNKKHKGNVNKT